MPRREPREYPKPSFDRAKPPEKKWNHTSVEPAKSGYPKQSDTTPRAYTPKKDFSDKKSTPYDDGTPRPGEKLSWRKNTKRSERSFSKNKAAEYEAKKWQNEKKQPLEKKSPSLPKESIEKSHPPKPPRTRPGARKSNPKPFIASAPKGAKKV